MMSVLNQYSLFLFSCCILCFNQCLAIRIKTTHLPYVSGQIVVTHGHTCITLRENLVCLLSDDKFLRLFAINTDSVKRYFEMDHDSKMVPPRRLYHTCVQISDNEWFVHGGIGGAGDKLLPDAWILSVNEYNDIFLFKWQLVSEHPEFAVAGHSAVAYARSVYFFGGRMGDSHLRRWDLDTHSMVIMKVTGERPPPVSYGSMDVVDGVIYVYGGGTTVANVQSAGMYKFDIATSKWSKAINYNHINFAGYEPALFYSKSVVRKKLIFYVFGANGAAEPILNVYDTAKDQWLNPLTLSGVRGRFGHAVAINKQGNIFVHGGEDSNRMKVPEVDLIQVDDTDNTIVLYYYP